MPTERRRQRQFDLSVGDLVQFLGLPGVRRAARVELVGPLGGQRDVWWTPEGVGYFSDQLGTEEILAALAGPAERPDCLELRPAVGQSFEVTIPSVGHNPSRTFTIEPTEWGLRQLAGLVAAQARRSGVGQSASIPSSWVPSDWDRLYDEDENGRKRYVGKVRRYDAGGRQVAVAASMEELGL